MDKALLPIRDHAWAIGGSEQFIYNRNLNTAIWFLGFSSEQYVSPLLSVYGSVGFGRSTNGTEYVKIPITGLFTFLGSLIFGNKGLINQVPGIAIMDGIALNFRLGNSWEISPYTGLIMAIPLNRVILSDSMIGLEGGLRFYYYINQRIRASVTIGTYLGFSNFIFAYNGLFSLTFLLNK